LRRGGLGYDKHYRALVDCHTIVTADRVRLGCYGVAGGKAGKPFLVTVDPEGDPRTLGGLVDGEFVAAGTIVRVETTGGGGWGDPLEREPELIVRDVSDGKISVEAAFVDYGAVIVPEGEFGIYRVDDAATLARRMELKAARNGPLPMIDRGAAVE
jgi:N-methylhydantoinase B